MCCLWYASGHEDVPILLLVLLSNNSKPCNKTGAPCDLTNMIFSIMPNRSAPSHYLNQCWNIGNWTLGDKLQRNSYIFIQENPFETVVWKMAAILSRPLYVNGSSQCYVNISLNVGVLDIWIIHTFDTCQMLVIILRAGKVSMWASHFCIGFVEGIRMNFLDC